MSETDGSLRGSVPRVLHCSAQVWVYCDDLNHSSTPVGPYVIGNALDAADRLESVPGVFVIAAFGRYDGTWRPLPEVVVEGRLIRLKGADQSLGNDPRPDGLPPGRRTRWRVECRRCRKPVQYRHQTLTKTLDLLADSGIGAVSWHTLADAAARRKVD